MGCCVRGACIGVGVQGRRMHTTDTTGLPDLEGSTLASHTADDLMRGVGERDRVCVCVCE